MTNHLQMATENPSAECCHRRRFPVDYGNHEKIYAPRLEVEAQLLASRGRRAGVRVAAAQRRGTARILRREWDSTWRNPHGGGHQTPVFAGLPAVRRRTSGTARVEKPAFSGLPGIAIKNGGMKSTETFSRTLAATRIFEHYELTSMRSGMVVK